MKYMESFRKSCNKGFTLIELLIVIAILGILASATLVAINPVDKINAANDSRVQSDIASLANASVAYSTTHNGLFPAVIADLTASGEIKVVPSAPTGYTYYFAGVPSGCAAGTTCTDVIITSPLKSSKFTTPGTPNWRFESSTGKICAVASPASTTACP